MVNHIFGDKVLNYYKIVAVIVAVALSVSLILNLYFYLYVRVQNENVTNNMRARALASYGGQMGTIKYLFNKYLDTKNRSLIGNEAMWCAYGAELMVDACRQGSDEEIYNQLWKTAHAVRMFGLDVREAPITNETKISLAISSLDHISHYFAGFEMLRDVDPIKHLSQVYGANATATVIYYCEILQDNLSSLLE